MRRLLFALMLGCGGMTTSPEATATLTGTLTLREGDCMPPTNPTFCKISTPSRAVYLFPVQHFDESAHAFPTSIDAAPVAQTTSDGQGRYTMHAPPGRWSVFVEDQGHLYANEYSGPDDDINAVDLADGETSTFDVTINHATD